MKNKEESPILESGFSSLSEWEEWAETLRNNLIEQEGFLRCQSGEYEREIARREASLTAAFTIGPEGYRNIKKKADETLGPEGRSLLSKKGRETLGPEGCRKVSLKAAETLGFEGASKRSKKIAVTLGPEGCRNRALTREKNMGPEGRRAANLKGSKTLGADGRRATNLKGGHTKYQKKYKFVLDILEQLPEVFDRDMFNNAFDKVFTSTENLPSKRFNNGSSHYFAIRISRQIRLLKNGNQFIGPTTYKKCI